MAIKNIFADLQDKKALIQNLSIDELAGELEDDRTLLVDLRELQERVDLGTIPGSKHVPRGMLEFWADPSSPYYRDYFTEDRRTIVFCAGGGRSVLAALALEDMGFKNVAHVEEGFRGWQESGRPVEDVAATSRWVRRDPKG
jgi:rhodanese-related sulfurtransferase